MVICHGSSLELILWKLEGSGVPTKNLWKQLKKKKIQHQESGKPFTGRYANYVYPLQGLATSFFSGSKWKWVFRRCTKSALGIYRAERKRRKKDWAVGESELSCSLNEDLSQSCMGFWSWMAVQNYSKTGWMV